MPKFRTLDDLEVEGRRVLVRVDLNVPMKNGKVADSARIDRQAPTIRELADKGAKVIVLSHFERPKGKVVPSMSLKPVVPALSKAVRKPVAFAEDCVGEKAKAAVSKLNNGEVLLLENTRFHAGEEANDPDFAKQLASLGDIYVNDASLPRTARTRLPKDWRISCHPPPGARCRRSSSICTRPWAIRCIR